MIDPERKKERNKDARDVKRGSELPPPSLSFSSGSVFSFPSNISCKLRGRRRKRQVRREKTDLRGRDSKNSQQNFFKTGVNERNSQSDRHTVKTAASSSFEDL